MTNEEAKEVLWFSTIHLAMFEDSLEAIEIAREALDKQIPKKPNKKGFEYFCPCCEETCVGKNHTDGNKTRKHYCFNCGQAIDWSEE